MDHERREQLEPAAERNDVYPVYTTPRLYAFTYIVKMKNLHLEPLYVLQHHLNNVSRHCIPHVICFNVSKEHSSTHYLDEFAQTCNGDRTTFANKYELKEKFGGLFIVIDLRIENVFGYTLDDLYQVYVNALENAQRLRVGATLPEDIYLESSPDRNRHLGRRPDYYKVDLNICHSGPADFPYRVMQDIFDRVLESGIKLKVGMYDNRTRVLPGLRPTRYSLCLAARLSNPSTSLGTKMINQLMTESVGASRLNFNVR